MFTKEDIQFRFVLLKTYLDVSPVIDRLYSENCLRKEDQDRIKSGTTPAMQRERLLDIFLCKSQADRDKLGKVIYRFQPHLLGDIPPNNVFDHDKVLRQHWNSLVEDIEYMAVEHDLYQHEVLRRDEINDIKAQPTKLQQAGYLLECIQRKSPCDYVMFRKLLRKTYKHLYDLLTNNDSLQSPINDKAFSECFEEEQTAGLQYDQSNETDTYTPPVAEEPNSKVDTGLPANREKLYNPSADKCLYVNHVTKDTQWDPPGAELKGAEEPDSKVDTGLPVYWEKLYDPSAGKCFYVNHVTKDTQWYPPQAELKDDDFIESYELPSWWEEKTDPRSGKSVYVNHRTKKTQWKAPLMVVVRRPKQTEAVQKVTVPLPTQWSDDKLKQLFIRIELKRSSSEFQSVEIQFYRSSSPNWPIRKIERVQNPTLYRQYVIKRESMTNPGELALWHGTHPDVTEQINARGFDRNFSGKNAVLYGQGAYFAKDPSYSQRYATPNKNGEKRMYLCKVLTGDYTLGNNTMKAPPPKDPSTPHIMFDSVVNDLKDPTIFVVFADAQAYPEYLLTFG